MSELAEQIAHSLAEASWVRRMFEAGRKLVAQFGPDQVCDFSIGNPHLEPPPAIVAALRAAANDTTPGLHRYMSSSGFPEVREQVARWLSRQQGIEIPARHVIMTVGCAGAINAALHALLNPGEGVVLFAPWFAEYPFYLLHAQALRQVAPTTDDFDLDPAALERALTGATRFVFINSPNNPTGRVYDETKLREVIELLRRLNQQRQRPVVLLFDEVYRRIVFDGLVVPQAFRQYEHSVLCSSFSKDLGLAGERIGYLALHPDFPEAETVLQGIELCHRTLGMVNAPALFQRAVADHLDALVEVAAYHRNRDALCGGLRRIGYDLFMPQGSFFAFPRCPIADDQAFARRLLQERILVVPGMGFDRPGAMRLSAAVAPAVIERALPGFARAFHDPLG